MAGEASFLCISPADEFTSRDHHAGIEVHSLVLLAGVLWTKAVVVNLSLLSFNFPVIQ